jgi:universal stress protein A
MIDLHRILVPTDFSTHSRNALRYAAAFADRFGAELHLLHVVQDLALFVPDTVAVSPVAAPPLDRLTAAVREALLREVRESGLEGRAVCLEVREGTPFEEIVRYAREKAVDLIVLGTHGRTGLAHVLLGSVSEKVVRKAPCPVLTVRHPEHEFVHP